MIGGTQDGRAFRVLTILDEYTRECLSIIVARKITAQEVIHQLAELFLGRRIPEQIRSDNGPEVHGQGGSGVVKGSWSKDSAHRAREPMGEPVY